MQFSRAEVFALWAMRDCGVIRAPLSPAYANLVQYGFAERVDPRKKHYRLTPDGEHAASLLFR